MCAGLLVVLAIDITIAVFLGFYSYKNTDPGHCFYIHGIDRPGNTKSELVEIAMNSHIKVPEGQPLDYHHTFVTWFTWGFWTFSFPIVLLPIVALVDKIDSCKGTFESILGVMWGINTLLWTVMGSVWRFNAGGKVCSGDLVHRKEGVTDEQYHKSLDAAQQARGYQFHSGKLMFILLIVMFTIAGLIISGGVAYLLWYCFCQGKNDQNSAA